MSYLRTIAKARVRTVLKDSPKNRLEHALLMTAIDHRFSEKSEQPSTGDFDMAIGDLIAAGEVSEKDGTYTLETAPVKDDPTLRWKGSRNRETQVIEGRVIVVKDVKVESVVGVSMDPVPPKPGYADLPPARVSSPAHKAAQNLKNKEARGGLDALDRASAATSEDETPTQKENTDMAKKIADTELQKEILNIVTNIQPASKKDIQDHLAKAKKPLAARVLKVLVKSQQLDVVRRKYSLYGSAGNQPGPKGAKPDTDDAIELSLIEQLADAKDLLQRYVDSITNTPRYKFLDGAVKDAEKRLQKYREIPR